MSTLILTPNIYKKGLKWSVLPRNKIDTVNIKAVINDNMPPDTVDSRDITSGVDRLNRAVSLPIADNNNVYDNLSVAWVNSKSGTFQVVRPFLGCFIALELIKGSYQIELNEPFVGTPTAKFTLTGSTRSFQSTDGDLFDDIISAVTDNSATDAISIIDDNKNNDSIISDNKSTDEVNRASTGSSLLIDYKNEIPMTPFVRKTTGNLAGITMTVAEYLMSDYKPKLYDVFPQWVRGTDVDHTYNFSDFFFTTSLSNRNKITQGPAVVQLNRPTQNQCIKVAENNMPIYCTATKLTDRLIQIDFQLPARYVYIACATARGSINGQVKQDPLSYGWVDNISNIHIETVVTQLNKDTVDLSYGLDANEDLTNNVNNISPFNLSNNEFITQNATWDSDSWTEAMAEHILKEYKNGKHIIECDVYAKWAIDNAIDINTQIKIKLHDGSFIQRDGVDVIFEIKNVEKRFSGSEFVYRLKMLESNSSNV